MRVAVTGGRFFDYWSDLCRELDAVKPDHVAQGGSTGADELAVRWCEMRRVTCTTYHAQWGRYGNRAGPIRNRLMLEDFRPDLLVAFPGWHGTADCVRTARELDIEVHAVHVDVPSAEEIRQAAREAVVRAHRQQAAGEAAARVHRRAPRG